MIDNIENLIASLSVDGRLPYAEKLAKRIKFLCEPDDDDMPPSVTSLEGLIQFLHNHPNVVYPVVTLGFDGKFMAQWRRDENHDLTVIFSDKQRVVFVLSTSMGNISGNGNIKFMWESIKSFWQ